MDIQKAVLTNSEPNTDHMDDEFNESDGDDSELEELDALYSVDSIEQDQNKIKEKPPLSSSKSGNNVNIIFSYNTLPCAGAIRKEDGKVYFKDVELRQLNDIDLKKFLTFVCIRLHQYKNEQNLDTCPKPYMRIDQNKLFYNDEELKTESNITRFVRRIIRFDHGAEKLRAEERRKKKERKEKIKNSEGPSSEQIADRPSRKELKRRKMKDSNCQIAVVFDLSFDNLMIPKDMGKVVKQILRVYSENRRAKASMQLHLTNFEGDIKEEMEKHGGYANWDMNFHAASYLDVFAKEKLVYLTSESDNVLTELSDDKVYIIGGLVDHNSHKGICFEKAKKEGIAHAQLPLDEFFELKRRKVFTINQVFEILLTVAGGRSFKDAFEAVIPKRFNLRVKGRLKQDLE